MSEVPQDAGTGGSPISGDPATQFDAPLGDRAIADADLAQEPGRYGLTPEGAPPGWEYDEATGWTQTAPAGAPPGWSWDPNSGWVQDVEKAPAAPVGAPSPSATDGVVRTTALEDPTPPEAGGTVRPSAVQPGTLGAAEQAEQSPPEASWPGDGKIGYLADGSAVLCIGQAGARQVDDGRGNVTEVEQYNVARLPVELHEGGQVFSEPPYQGE